MGIFKRFDFSKYTHESKLPEESKEFINQYFGYDSFLTLFNYKSSGITARLSTAGTLLELYKKIENGEWEKHWEKQYSEKEKTIVLEMLQIDLLSKAMIAIEDLSTFSSCFPRNIKDLHRRVYVDSNFNFIKSITKHKHLNFADIYGFPVASRLKLNDIEKAVYEKIREKFHNLVKAKFLALEEFRNTYYQAYIGFKHSYAGLMPNCKIAESNKPGAEIWEETIWIGEKRKPFSFNYGGYIIQSYANADKYFTVIAVATHLMLFLTQNWLEKVWFRDINTLPVEIYKTEDINGDELSTIKKIWKEQKEKSKEILFDIEIGKWSPSTGPNIYDYDFGEVFKDKFESL
ncbi:MAG: hypothetical protein KKA19_01930 [Candidatus Margulisbacteria bacterium]|nr:hypothetical protein [Candidatus Margulisiibacteriota bacterium]